MPMHLVLSFFSSSLAYLYDKNLYNILKIFV